MAKKFNDPSIATITVLNDADMMSTFDASTGELNKILVSDAKASGFGRFGVSGEDDTAAEDRAFDANGHELGASNASDFYLQAGGDSPANANAGVAANVAGDTLAQLYAFDVGGSIFINITLGPTYASIVSQGGTYPTSGSAPSGGYYIPLSVNNTFADSAGNIPLVAIADDFLNDAAAATGGIAVGGLYHTSGVVKIRLS